MSKTSVKCVVLGLDGATFRQILPLAEQGLLPNFSRIMMDGARARLVSTIPWQTPVAWSSYATGVNPAKHGIFGWWSPVGNELVTASGKDIVAARFWEVLGGHGVRVGVVNVPMSYPARPVPGFVISGFDTPFEAPALDPTFTYPRNLFDWLNDRGKSYTVIPRRKPNAALDDILAEWARADEEKIDAALTLVEAHQPEFLQVNLFFTDFMSHRAAANNRVMQATYREADRMLGRLRDALGDQVLFLVVSDHGSCPITQFVMVHNILGDAGLLSFHPWLADENVDACLGSEAPPEERQALLKRLKLEGPRLRAALYDTVRDRYPGANVGFSTIDWDKTRVFTVSDYGQLWINRSRGAAAVESDGEYRDLLSQARELLLSLRDPATGSAIVSEVVPGSDLYTGQYAARAPDLTPLPADYSYYFCQVYSFYRSGESRHICPIASVVDPVETANAGDHDPYGILLASGPNVPHGLVLDDANILDIAPTIVSFFQLAPLPDWDGCILRDLFGGHRQTVQRTPGSTTASAPDSLRERIKALGYRL